MVKQSTYAVLTIVIAAFAYSVAGQDNSASQVVISIKVCEQAADGSPAKILAEPTIATTAGRAFSFDAGGRVKANAGDKDFVVGTRLNGQFERTDKGAVQLDLKIRIGSTVPQEQDPQTELLRTEIIEIRTVVQPGKTKRLACSDSQWCEVTVAPAR